MIDDPIFAGDCTEQGRIIFDSPQAVIALCKAKFAGERVDVRITRRKARRTDRQNRAFWALLTPWARELGYTAPELKEELLGLLWGWDETTSRLTGEVRQVPRKGRSSKLTTAEFAELIDFMVIKAAETGYVMVLPDEFRARKAKEARAAA